MKSSLLPLPSVLSCGTSIRGSLTFFRATNSFSAVALSATSSSYLETKDTKFSDWNVNRLGFEEAKKERMKAQTDTFQELDHLEVVKESKNVRLEGTLSILFLLGLNSTHATHCFSCFRDPHS